ncbi:MAG: magnesium and cobalt exporter, family, partial [Pseudonocardiales bacterium]|nr:magnesium and cobalt exporter, family [Pseudonocardiales bacterium]
MTGPDLALLVAAVLLVPAAGALAAVDVALARVSVARVEEFVREHRRGAASLAKVLSDRARHTNLILLLRVTAELTATVFATVVAISQWGARWPVVLATVAVMVVVSYVLIGVGPRTLGR